MLGYHWADGNLHFSHIADYYMHAGYIEACMHYGRISLDWRAID